MPPTTEGVLTTVSAPKVNTAERPYSYKALTEKQLYIYNILIDGLQQHKDSVSFEPSMNITADDYCGVYQIIYDDEPAMFYIDTKMQYTVNSKTKVISGAYLFYKYSENETEKMQKAIDTEADKILAKITSTMTEYDKVKLFHDSLASSVVYDDTANNCRDIYGVFVDKKAICGGYSKAFSYLCTKAGIESLTVTGDADGQPHMWNKVKIDGKWYNIDVTYAVSSEVMGNFVRYDYFCVTDKMLEASRTIYEQPYEYPKATADDCDYYVKNDLVADSWEEVRAILLDSIIEAAKTKASPVQVKCATKELYNEAIKNLFSQSEKQALKIYDEAYDAAENKYDCDMVTYNQDSTSLVIKLFLEYDE